MVRTEWQNKAMLRQVESESRTRQREFDPCDQPAGRAELPDREEQDLRADERDRALYVDGLDIAEAVVDWPLAVGSTAVERQEPIYIPIESSGWWWR